MVEDEPHMTVWYNCAVMLLGLLETLSLMLDLFKACSVGRTRVEELTPDTTFLYGGTSTCFKKVRGQEIISSHIPANLLTCDSILKWI